MNDIKSGSDPEYIPPGAIESISRAEIDVAISTARKFTQHAPHQLAKVKQDMLSFATLDRETAESCFYSLPRGGKLIKGPSVRLAEIAVSCYGNLRCGTRIIETVIDGQDPHVVIQAVAQDLEKNIHVSIEKRRRITKKKSKDRIDEDDVNLATNACSAIAFRDAAYKVIPLALIKPVYEAAIKVAVGDAKTLGERRGKCLDTYAKMGVSKEKILDKLEKKNIDEINLEDLELLLGLFTAIKDGEVKLDEAFTSDPSHSNRPQATGYQQATQPKAATNQPQITEKPIATVKNEDNVPMDFPAEDPPEAGDPQKASINVPETAGGPNIPSTPPNEQAPSTAEALPAKSETVTPPETPQEPPDPLLGPENGDTDSVASVKLLASKAGVNYFQLRTYLLAKHLCRPEQKTLKELADTKLQNIARNFHKWLPDIKTLPRSAD